MPARVAHRGTPVTLLLTAGALAACLALAALARAQSPTPGGSVPSTLELSLSGPSPFKRVGETAEGKDVYAATLRAEVTATDTPSSLGLGDDPPLRIWHEPLAGEQAKIPLRVIVPDRRALHNRTVLVTLTAGGP